MTRRVGCHGLKCPQCALTLHRTNGLKRLETTFFETRVPLCKAGGYRINWRLAVRTTVARRDFRAMVAIGSPGRARAQAVEGRGGEVVADLTSENRLLKKKA